MTAVLHALPGIGDVVDGVTIVEMRENDHGQIVVLGVCDEQNRYGTWLYDLVSGHLTSPRHFVIPDAAEQNFYDR